MEKKVKLFSVVISILFVAVSMAYALNCSKCKKSLPDNAKFCLECGTKVEQVKKDTVTNPKGITLEKEIVSNPKGTPSGKAVSAENLISNGGFESINSEGNPADWTWNPKTMFLLNDDASEGKNYVKLVRPDAGSSVILMKRNIVVEPNKNYQLSAKVRGSYPKDIERTANLNILASDGNNDKWIGLSQKLSNYKEWYEIAHQFNTLGNNQISVYFDMMPGPKDAWLAIDDVRLEEYEPKEVLTNVLVNPGFEIGELSYMPVGWFSTNRDAKNPASFATRFEVTDEIKHSGKQSFFVECEVGQKFGLVSAKYLFEPNATYSLSLWMKSDKEKLPVVVIMNCEQGSLGHKTVVNTVYVNTEWQEYKIEGNLPPEEYLKNGVYVQIQANPFAEVFALWIDDVNMSKVK